MKANELRTGNLVESIIQLTGSLPEKCRFDGNILIVNKYFIFHDLYEKCKGIPLTEEWLKKLGFENETKYFDSLRAKIRLDFRNPYYAARLKRNNTWAFLNNIFYVHQLQNLYFALTGEELTTK